MKKIIILLFVFTVITFARNSRQGIFIKNNGQWNDEVLYLAQTPGMNAWITKAGVVYDYYKIIGGESLKNITKFTPPEKVREIESGVIRTGIVVNSIYENANENLSVSPEGKQNFHYNYFIGNDKSNWTAGVHVYKTVTVNEIYDGIGIRYSFEKNSLRYDYEIAPEADISQIKLKFEGTDEIHINNKGEVVIHTSFGTIIHGNILAFQGNNKVDCSFREISKNCFGISVSNYDKTKELIIDPLVYCTYLGGGFAELFNDIILDENNNALICGETRSPDFPTTPGSYSETWFGDHDVIVSKFNEDASQLIFSTFIGGAVSYEEAKDIALDDSGNVYITGLTWSSDYPATTLYTQFKGNYDAFLTELTGDTGQLINSTYLGGDGADEGFAIALNDSNDIYITGFTGSENFPFTLNAFSDTLNGSSVDIFITKISDFQGVQLLNKYSTVLGGGGQDEARDIAIDENNNVYLAGMTKSGNFPVTTNAAFSSGGGGQDGFILKFSMNENNILYSSYLGGSDDDYIDGFDIDAEKNIYLTGTTYSDDFPTTPGAYNENFNGGYYDCFLTKLNLNNTTPLYSTYLGTSQEEQTFNVKVDDNLNALVVGYTRSNVFPLTNELFDYNGDWDIFVSGFSPDGASLVFSTYFGGAKTDMPTDLTLDQMGNIFITGQSYSYDLPVSTNAFQDSLVWMADGFIAKLKPVLTSIEDETISHPENFILYQNYPNPFNPTTTISYTIPSVETQHFTSQRVTLKIYNILGEEVATLVNERQAPGRYQVEFNASDLASGIYIYQLISFAGENKFIDSKKLMLLK